MALSATFPAPVIDLLNDFMRDPQNIILPGSSKSLKGIAQYRFVAKPAAGGGPPDPYRVLRLKAQRLLRILDETPFHQSIVFTNSRARARELCDSLLQEGHFSSVDSVRVQPFPRGQTLARQAQTAPELSRGT